VPTLISVAGCKPDILPQNQFFINRSYVFGSLLQAFNIPQSVQRNLVGSMGNAIRIDQLLLETCPNNNLRKKTLFLRVNSTF
jgi:hypothetical protein